MIGKAEDQSEPSVVKSIEPERVKTLRNPYPVTLSEIVQEYERDLEARRRLYPELVKSGKLRQEDADRRIEILEYGLARETANLTAIRASDNRHLEKSRKKGK